MDSTFWQAIVEADCAVPEGHTATELCPVLVGYLGSTDPQLRDEFAYTILSRWIIRAVLGPADLRPLLIPLTANLAQGIGQAESDSVFLRSFSALILAAIIYADNQQAFLSTEEVHAVFAAALTYLAREQDVRGYVAGQGWAHSVAHTADLLDELALSRYVTPEELARILDAIARKLAETPHLLLFKEDDRLSYAALTVLKRGQVPLAAVERWAGGLGELPAALGRTRIFSDPARQAVYLNTRAFLRSLILRLLDEALPSVVRAAAPPIRAALAAF